jgi:hypothetical protein
MSMRLETNNLNYINGLHRGKEKRKEKPEGSCTSEVILDDVNVVGLASSVEVEETK